MPKHPDFVKIYNQFVKRYGKERGERFYYSWLSKMKLDDTKPYGAQKESFRWVAPHLLAMKEDETNVYWKAEVAFPVASMNRNVYTEDELKSASRTLIGKPVNINHDTSIQHEVEIVDAEFEDGALEVLLKVPKASQINKQIADGLGDNPSGDAIVHSSLEATCLRGTEPHPEGKKCCGLVFDGLALLTKDVLPGIPLTRFYAAESMIGEFEAMVAEMVVAETPNKEVSETNIEADVMSKEPTKPQAPTTPAPSQMAPPGASAKAPDSVPASVTTADIASPQSATATPQASPPPATVLTSPAPGTAEPQAISTPTVPSIPTPAPEPKGDDKGANKDSTPKKPEPTQTGNDAPVTIDPNVIPDPGDDIVTDDGFWKRFNLYHKTHGLSRQDSFRLTAMDVLKVAQKVKK